MLLDRRTFFLSAAAAGLAGSAWPALAALDPKLQSVLDAIAWDVLNGAPEGLSQLGLDPGEHAPPRAPPNARSAADRAKVVASIPRYQHMLAAVNRSALTGHDRL